MTAWSSERALGAPRALGLGLGIELLLLLTLALGLRVAWLGAGLHFDELYHLLAAEGWLRTGEPQIGNGAYERALPFTIVIAGTIHLLGYGIEAARLPALVLGAALVVMVFLWTRAVAGRLAAWTAALLLATSTLAIEQSVLLRFYTWQALALWLAALCAWHLAEDGKGDRAWQRVALVLAGLVCALLALAVHELSVVYLASIALWLAATFALRAWSHLRSPRRRLGAGLAMATACTALALAVLASGMLDDLVARYRWVPLWAAEHQGKVHYYHARLIEAYPFLWALTPFAALAALGRWPRAAGFCLTVFAVSFVLVSFGGMKSDRYLFAALPFLFALWGMGLAAVAPVLRAAVTGLADRVLDALAVALPRRLARWVILGPSLLFLFAASGDPLQTARALATGQLPHAPGRNVIASDWPQARAALAPWLGRADVVASTDELSALYFLGRVDLLISGTRLSEVESGREFTRDPRTGLPVISAASSLARVVACYRSGLIVVPGFDLTAEWTVFRPTADALVDLTTALDLPALPDLRVFWWEDGGDSCPPGPQ